jgi:hypothetical protein
MTLIHPPRLAIWLLVRLVSSDRRESLIGDLIEQYHGNPSRAWFWRETLVAIAVTAARDVQDHKALALRALAVGTILYIVLSFPANALTFKTRVWLTLSISDAWAMFWMQRLSSTFFASLACGFAGWFVARSHRGTPALVVLYAFSDLLFEYALVGWMFAHEPHVVTSQTELVVPLVLLIARPVSILIGGLWGLAEADRGPESPRYVH